MCLLACVLFLACTKEESIEGGGISTASGSLKDTAGNCVPPAVLGNYVVGTAVTDSNYILAAVRVQAIGNYKIFSSTQNGVYFTDSGYFSSTGTKVVKLKAIGTPTLAGTNTYSLTFDTSICSFSIVYNTAGSGGGTGGGGGGGTVNINDNDSAWQFVENGVFYHGPFTNVTLNVTPAPTNVVAFNMIGETFLTGDTSISLTVGNRNGTPIVTGNYPSNNNSVGSTFTFTDDAGALPVILMSASPVTVTPGVNLTFIVTAYDATTKIIEGTFSGTVANTAGTGTKTITLGKFKAQAQ